MNLKRTSIMTVVYNFFQLVFSLVIIYYPAKQILKTSSNNVIRTGVYFFVFLQFVSFFGSLLRWATFKYGIYEDSLFVRKGIINKSQRKIPISKIRQYKQKTSWLYRILRMTRLIIDTGIDSDEGTIDLDMISRRESKILKNKLNIAGVEDADNKDVDFFRGQFNVDNKFVRRIFKPSKIDIFISSITTFQLVVCLVALDSFKTDLTNFSFGNKVLSLIIKSINVLINSKYNLLIFFLIFLLLLISGFIREYLIFGNFELLSDNENFYSLEGIINRSVNSFKKKRIKTFKITSNIAMQLFELVKVDVYTASPSGMEESKHLILPFIGFKKCAEIFVNEFGFENYQTISLKIDKLVLLKLSMFTGLLEVVMVPLYSLLGEGPAIVYSLFILVYFLLLTKRVIFTNLICKDGFIGTRNGMVIKTEFLSKVSNVERYYVKQGPVQKLFKTYTLIVCFRAAPVKKRKVYFLNKERVRRFQQNL
ncbi:PH domain-containing protein [Pediococcus acidilactici]|uniref:PH domain-containing protein n=1 Tax=Pediococcus acidilactici TaxID=1254 RepID=UPI002706198E|nr:PH domain-containing protein [Pediococcus acidilactici]MDO7803237.1 PH domain-containing protein [Pediococcus acidilactici]